MMARRFGVHTREILLLPIGGIASIARIPKRPSQELAIALIGPAINVTLAVVLWLGIVASGNDPTIGAATSLGGAFATQLMWINLGLAIFNLVPAFPMDGGRVLRALLAMRMSRVSATEVATRIGMLFAIDATVAVAPHHGAIIATPEERLDVVFEQLRSSPDTIVVVEDHGDLLGIITPEQLATFAALRPRLAASP
jgi:Zn-dependent protease